MSIDLFITRIEECRQLAGLSQSEVLPALSELLTGVAATWFRNNRHQWSTWPEFCFAARKWYGTNRREQQRLADCAQARTQGEGEPVREYITCLQAIIKKLEPQPDIHQQIDLLHGNMQPEMQSLVARESTRTLDEFIEKVVDAELTLEKRKTFKPPPPPEDFYLPEFAFKPSKNKQARVLNKNQGRFAPERPPTIASVETEPQLSGVAQDKAPDITQQLITEMRKLSASIANLQKRSPPNSRSSSPKGSPKRNYYRRSEDKGAPKNAPATDQAKQKPGGQSRQGGSASQPNNRGSSNGQKSKYCTRCKRYGHSDQACQAAAENRKGSRQ